MHYTMFCGKSQEPSEYDIWFMCYTTERKLQLQKNTQPIRLFQKAGLTKMHRVLICMQFGKPTLIPSHLMPMAEAVQQLLKVLPIIRLFLSNAANW